MTSRNLRRLARAPAFALAAALILAAGQADARAGGSFGGGFGSRGSRTYAAPPATSTSPRTAAPIERSATPQPGTGYQQPGFQPRPAAAPGGFFSRNGGFLGGLVGAGLIGMLLGGGLLGGFGGFGSMLGFLVQIALIAFLARWAWGVFQRRQAGAPAAAAGAGLAGRFSRDAAGAAPGYGGGPRAPGGGRVRDEVGVGQGDLEEFQRLLATLQTAFGQEDRATLGAITTPEVAAYLGEELDRNAARGLVNRVRDPVLLQGDLAEAWREGDAEYATVAMRFSLVDWTEERASGRVVAGDPGKPEEVTEVWTFVRPRRGRWKLSAIQRA